MSLKIHPTKFQNPLDTFVRFTDYETMKKYLRYWQIDLQDVFAQNFIGLWFRSNQIFTRKNYTNWKKTFIKTFKKTFINKKLWLWRTTKQTASEKTCNWIATTTFIIAIDFMNTILTLLLSIQFLFAIFFLYINSSLFFVQRRRNIIFPLKSSWTNRNKS